MKIIPGNAQHIGSRLEQQDGFGFSDFNNRIFVSHGGVLALLTDGMGGLLMGREASQIAKQIMLKEYESKDKEESIQEALYRAMSATNKAVLQMASNESLDGEMGTTLVAAAIKGSELYWISVGDSRIYLYRDGKIIQLSSDHDYAKELTLMAAAGEITREEAANHKDRNALINYYLIAKNCAEIFWHREQSKKPWGPVFIRKSLRKKEKSRKKCLWFGPMLWHNSPQMNSNVSLHPC